jgi:prevent-host-death family protein
MYNVVTFEVRMSELRVGVRELKSRLSEYLRRVKLGETILVTEHGHPLGRIVPAEMPLEEKMKGMISSGLAQWSGKKPEPVSAPAVVRSGKSVAEIILADRE